MKLITKKLVSGHLDFDYRSQVWNNYDLFSLCLGIFRHGFGEWETILKDEVIWAMHLKSNEQKLIDDDLDDDDKPKKDFKIPQQTYSIFTILQEKLIPSSDINVSKASSTSNKYPHA